MMAVVDQVWGGARKAEERRAQEEVLKRECRVGKVQTKARTQNVSRMGTVELYSSGRVAGHPFAPFAAASQPFRTALNRKQAHT